MSTQGVSEASEQFVSVAETLPRELLATNAPQLRIIARELESSYAGELWYVEQVIDVDTSNADECRELRRTLERHARRQHFHEIRTRCGDIDLIAETMGIPPEPAAPPAGLERLAETLGPLREADSEFEREIETFLKRALHAAAEIDDCLPNRPADASLAHDKFAREMEDDVERLRNVLQRLDRLVTGVIGVIPPVPPSEADIGSALKRASDQFAAVVKTMPKELVATNAPQLRLIARELERSFYGELWYVEQVVDVDASDQAAVHKMRRDLVKHRREELFNSLRTHCEHIELIAQHMGLPREQELHDPATRAAVPSELWPLVRAVDPLRELDLDVGREIQTFLVRAVDTAVKMDDLLSASPSRPADARSVQDRFRQEMEADTARINGSLARLHALVRDVIRLM